MRITVCYRAAQQAAPLTAAHRAKRNAQLLEANRCFSCLIKLLSQLTCGKLVVRGKARLG
jgi:hypothetical protein